MSIAFQLKGVRVNNPNLPVISSPDLVRSVFYELDAASHFIIGESLIKSLLNYGKSGLSGNVPNDEPTILDNYGVFNFDYTIDTGILMQSPLTICTVTQLTASKSFLSGGYGDSNAGFSSGRENRNGTEMTAGLAAFQNLNTATGNSSYSFRSIPDSDRPPSVGEVEVGKWYFVAVSLGPDFFTSFVGSKSSASVASVVAPNTTGETVHIGSHYYKDSSWQNDVRISECVVFDSYKSASELQQLYQRSKTRMADLGIVVE